MILKDMITDFAYFLLFRGVHQEEYSVAWYLGEGIIRNIYICLNQFCKFKHLWSINFTKFKYNKYIKLYDLFLRISRYV